MIREAQNTDLDRLLSLYTFLHGEELIDSSDGVVQTLWREILNDPHHHIIVAEEDALLVSSCVCVVIPNLTRNLRPYALIENVVTQEKYRKKGYATACLAYAKTIAEEAGCYKIMLSTSSDEESVHRFYRSAGYNSKDKTAYVQWL